MSASERHDLAPRSWRDSRRGGSAPWWRRGTPWSGHACRYTAVRLPGEPPTMADLAAGFMIYERSLYVRLCASCVRARPCMALLGSVRGSLVGLSVTLGLAQRKRDVAGLWVNSLAGDSTASAYEAAVIQMRFRPTSTSTRNYRRLEPADFISCH